MALSTAHPPFVILPGTVRSTAAHHERKTQSGQIPSEGQNKVGGNGSHCQQRTLRLSSCREPSALRKRTTSKKRRADRFRQKDKIRWVVTDGVANRAPSVCHPAGNRPLYGSAPRAKNAERTDSVRRTKRRLVGAKYYRPNRASRSLNILPTGICLPATFTAEPLNDCTLSVQMMYDLCTRRKCSSGSFSSRYDSRS